MKLPLSDGHFNFEMDFLKKKGGIILEAEKFDLAYFKQRIPDFPLSGRVKGRLRVDFEPELTIKLIANSDELKLDGIPLRDSFLEIYLKKSKFQWKLKDRSLYTFAHGKHRLFDFVNTDVGLDFVDVLGDLRFEVKESRLQRFSKLPYLDKLRFKKGNVELSGKYDKSRQTISLKSQTLSLVGENNRLDFNAKSPIEITNSRLSSGSVEVWTRGILNNTKHKLADIKLKKNNVRLELDQFRFSLLKEFSLDAYLLPFHGTLDMDLEINNFHKDPIYEMSFNAAPIYLDINGEESYLQRISGELFSDSRGLQARNINLLKQDVKFSIDGKLPIRLASKEWKFEVVDGGEMDMKLQIPETPIVVVKDLLPNFEAEIDGLFSLDVQLSGSVEEPLMNGKGYLNIDSMTVPSVSRSLDLKSGKLDLEFVHNYMKINQMQGRLGDMIFHLSGEVYPFEQFKFFLKGDVAQARFNRWFMDLNGARLSEVLVNGSRGQLQASASISAGKAVIFYEDLMRWIDRESSPLRVPFFPHYDFDLKIKQSENVQLHAEFFKMNIEPNMYIKIRPKQTYLKGHIGVRDGSLELARNHFKVDPSSMIRFIPREQKIKLSPSPYELESSSPVWKSGDFQLQSVTDKLQTMWERDFTNDSAMTGKLSWYEGDKTFDTRLNLRAVTEVGKRRVF